MPARFVRLFTNGPNWNDVRNGADGLVTWLGQTAALSELKIDFSIVGYDFKGHRPDPPLLVKVLREHSLGLKESSWETIAYVHFLGFAKGPDEIKYLFALNNISDNKDLAQAVTELILNGVLDEYILSPKEYVPA